MAEQTMGRRLARVGATLGVAMAAGCATARAPERPPAAEKGEAKAADGGCAQAAQERARVDPLLEQGRLLRALGVIEHANALCPEERAKSWAAQAEALGELGRREQATALLDEIAASPQATEADRRRAARVRAWIERSLPPIEPAERSGAGAFEGRLRDGAMGAGEALREGEPAEAHRRLDRMLAQAEREMNDWAVPFVSTLESMTMAVAWSGDGRKLAFSSADQALVVDVATGKLEQRIVNDSLVSALAFEPGGSLLVGLMSREMRRWQPGQSQAHAKVSPHASVINALSVSRDGRWLASGSDDRTVCLRAPSARDCERELLGHEDGVLSVAFSPDGRWLASGDRGGTVRLWEVETGKARAACALGQGQARSLAFAPRGAHVAVAGVDQDVRVWDALNQCNQVALKGHQEKARSVAWTGDGDVFAGADDSTLRRWRVACSEEGCALRGRNEGRLVGAWEYPGTPRTELSPEESARPGIGGVLSTSLTALGSMRALALSPDGRLLAAATGGTGAWVGPAEAGGALPWSLSLRPSAGSVMVLSGDGYLEIDGRDSQAFRCRLDSSYFPLALCRERYEVPGLWARTLRGDTGYRRP